MASVFNCYDSDIRHIKDKKRHFKNGKNALMITFIFLICLIFIALILCALWIQRFMISADRMQDMDVYRDQIKSLEKDKLRGIIDPCEYENLRTEIARRLLSAQKHSANPMRPSHNSVVIGLIIATTFIGGLLLYPWIGSPGFSDLPMNVRLDKAVENRMNLPEQNTLDRDAPELALPDLPEELPEQMRRLRDASKERPNDLQAFMLLSAWESRLGNFPAAHKAQAQVLKIRGTQATSADWGLYCELLIISAGNTISKQAEIALRETLRLNPQAPLARYRLGQLNAQIGRPDLTVRIWNGLLKEGPESAPYIIPIRSHIDEIAAQAGILRYEQPIVQGPKLEDIQAINGLNIEDRARMIEGMVAGLSDRLAKQGGPAQDWAQLIRAYHVLGRTEQAKGIYDEGQTVFAGQPSKLRLLDDAMVTESNPQ